jgi:hypothetical protein
MNTIETLKELLKLAHESLGSKDDEIADLEEVQGEDYLEASDFALSLYNKYYKSKPDAVNFELFDSVAAVITQIDNMVTGVIQDKDAKIAKLKKSDVKWLDLVVKLGENAVEMESKIAELKEQLEAAMTFNVDVVRCLSRIAVVENHNEVPAYIDMSRRCIKTIEAKQAKALKEQSK